jgi:hypothetical protein
MIKQNGNINEDEKNRILNLHESATKRMYLSEQNESEDLSYYEIDGTGLKFKIINGKLSEYFGPYESIDAPIGKIDFYTDTKRV